MKPVLKISIKDALRKPMKAAEGSSPEMDEEGGEEDSQMMTDAAAAVQDAMKGTPEELAQALKTFMECC